MLRRAAVLALFLFALGQVAEARVRGSYESSLQDELLDGHKIVNIVDDFLIFTKQARGLTLKAGRRLWKQTVEKKHHAYFEKAVYRTATPQERRAMLDNFLLRVGSRLDSIRELNEYAEDFVINGLVAFKWQFPEYRQQQDIYIGLSLFTFDGSVRPVNNEQGIPDSVCLGLDVLAGYSDEDLGVTVAHEFFHVHHFNYLFRHPASEAFTTAHIPLIVEGLAVAATESIYPRCSTESHLHFSTAELETQQAQLKQNSEEFLLMMLEGAPPQIYELWFKQSAYQSVPSRGGYLLGYEVAKRMLTTYSFEEIIRMNVPQLREHAEEQLSAMARGGVLLLAAN